MSRQQTIFIKNLKNIDAAVFEPSVGIVGHSWALNIEIAGNVDNDGLVIDFSSLKKTVVQVVKDAVDHTLLIPVASPSVRFSEDGSGGETWSLRAQNRMKNIDFTWEYSCPKGSVFPVRTAQVTRSVVEQELEKMLRHRLGPAVTSLRISLTDEVAHETTAFFRYTHGLTKHVGKCQRLFHGHRSRLEIKVGNERRGSRAFCL